MQYIKEHQAPFFTRVKDLFKLSLTALNDFKRRLCWSLASIHAIARFFIKHQKRPAIARPHKIAFHDHHGSKSTLFYACKQLLIARRVRWISDEPYDLRFSGDDSLYRYWDATEAVTFGLNMAHQALEQDLGEETKFLDRFDRAYQLVNEQFDVRGNDLTTLTLSCLQHNAILSKNRRQQFRLTVPESVFDAIEKACQSVLDTDRAQP